MRWFLVALVACSGRLDPGPSVPSPAPRVPREVDVQPSIERGIQIRLASADPNAIGSDQERNVAGTPMESKAIEALLKRATPLEGVDGDRQTFKRPAETLSPPDLDLVEVAAPSADLSAPAVPKGPVTVLRYGPEGDVPVAPKVMVTFDRPMVAVSSVEVTQETVPVTLDPEVEGQWRWLGTRTLVFEPTKRLPMATAFTVQTRASARSAAGEPLAKPFSWTFRTPPPKLSSGSPGTGLALDPLLVLSFDQPVDPQTVLAGTRLSPAAPLRLATPEEASGYGSAPTQVLLKPAAPLSVDTAYKLTIGAGLTGLEGPRPTTEPQVLSFRTYGPLKVEAAACGWSDGCPPHYPLQILATNSVDASLVTLDQFDVQPPVEDLALSTSGNYITLRGQLAPRTRYTVQVDPKLQDVFGQQLGSSPKLSFQTGSAYPVFRFTDDAWVVLDPANPKPSLQLYTRGVKTYRVRIYAVGPEDIDAFQSWRNHGWSDDRQERPGTLLAERRMEVSDPDGLQLQTIALAEHLDDGIGQRVVVVDAKTKDNDWRAGVWVQGTRLGLDAFTDRQDLWASVTDLATGRAAEGVTLTLREPGTAQNTDAKGLVHFPLPESARQDGLLVATKGKDVALMPASTWSGNRFQASSRSPWSAWFMFDDRGLYKPGEEVRMKGLHRWLDPGPDGDTRASDLTQLDWVAYDPRQVEIARGTVQVERGGFEVAFSLPEGTNLGYGRIEFKTGDLSAAHGFQIADFRRPEFEVSATMPGAPFFLGEHAIATAKASYFAGGGLPGANVDWHAYGTPTSYQPPNHEGFEFGSFSPWWWSWREAWFEEPSYGHISMSGTTDASGTHRVDVHFVSGEPKPMQVELAATISDVNRQQFTANASALVHPASYYVGLRADRAFVGTEDPLRLDAVVTDIDGKRVSDVPITITAVRSEWVWDAGTWSELEAERHTCEPTSTQDPVPCLIQPQKPGRFALVATVKDPQGRPNTTEMSMWVQGGPAQPSRDVELEQVLLIPDQDTYADGEVAEVFIQAPFAPADAVVTIERDGFIDVRRVAMETPSTTVEIPIDGDQTPGVRLVVEITGSSPRVDDAGKPMEQRRPAYATGSLMLKIPPTQRTLGVKLTPAASALRPGTPTAVDAVVTGPDGRPVGNAELTVWVVDEAVLALSGYDLADPMGTFYPERSEGVQARRFREMVKLADPADLERAAEEMNDAAEESMGGRGMMKSMAAMEPPPPPAPPPGQGGDAIQVRSDFRALAVWEGAARTDKAGKVHVAYKIPDSLTRYRILAVANDGSTRFGTGASAVTARNPLMIRPSAPRFLNFGDRFELPVVLQNQTTAPLTVDVALQAANLVFLDSLDQPGEPYDIGSSSAGRKVTVPPEDRVEIRFPMGTDMAGTARIQIVASAGDFSDATRIELPVYTPATSEAFATYGVLDEGGMKQPISTPGDVWTQYGGLEITTSSTALQSLTDAVIELTTYPYGCSEQIASRVMTIVALRDVLSAFEAKGMPSAAEIDVQLGKDLKRLAELQNRDGGFGFWRSGEASWPYVSLHVAHAVARALEKGIEVPETLSEGSRRYLREVPGNLDAQLDERTRRSLHAYAVYISALYGEDRVDEAVKLIGQDPSLEAKGWLLPILHRNQQPMVASVLRDLANRTDETAGNAHFVTAFDETDRFVLLASDRRVDGILLDALIQVQPENDLIPKLVSGLLAHRLRGHWGSTQDNAFVLLALDRYFRTYEGTSPDFMARAWLGPEYVGGAKFAGRETKKARIDIPMGELTEHPSQDLVLAKQGAGRMYYRIGLRYAPKDLELDAADRGFLVQRKYEAVDDPSDVTEADGIWTVRNGATVRVTVELVADGRRNHVAMVDPLPAGFEAVNSGLKGTAPTRPLESRGWWWGTWYVHDNLRDDRAEAFGYQLEGGVYTYSYLARATTPGSFVVPPARVEEMYAPETFGRSASTRVVVR